MSCITILSISFLLGTGLGLFFPPDTWTVYTLAGFNLVLLFFAAKKKRYVIPVCLIVFFLVGFSRPQIHEEPETFDLWLQSPCTRAFSGIVTSHQVTRDDKVKFQVKLNYCTDCLKGAGLTGQHKIRESAYVTIAGNTLLDAQKGDTVRIRGKIKPIVPLVNPGDCLTGKKNRKFSIFLSDKKSVIKEAHASISTMWKIPNFTGIRQSLAGFLNNALDPPKAAMARALILGERDALGRDKRDLFIQTGTAHLLAVSGLHLGLMAFLVFFVTRKLLVNITYLSKSMDVEIIACTITLAFTAVYTILTGSRIPVVRAFIMTGFVLVAKIIGRQKAVVGAVFAAALVLVLHDPACLVSPGFQLSFSAVVGLLYMSYRYVLSKQNRLTFVTPKMQLIQNAKADKEDKEHSQFWIKTQATIKESAKKSLAWIALLFISCLTAFTFTAPFVLWHFGKINMVSPLVNMVAVPLTSLFIMPGLLFTSFVFWIWKYPASICASVTGFFMDMLIFCLKLSKNFILEIYYPGTIAFILFIIAAGALICFLSKPKKWSAVVLVTSVLCVLGSFSLKKNHFPSNALVVDFFDVGQGDSTLITFPDGKHWLVDGGGSPLADYDTGKRILFPALKDLGVSTIEKIILTHPDLDHAGGLPYIAGNFDVKEILDTGYGIMKRIGGKYKELVTLARAKKIPLIKHDEICKSFIKAGVKADFIHPCKEHSGYYPNMSANNNSIVFQLKYKNVSFLLAGDIEKEVEKLLVKERIIPKVDVIKVSHHGSATSTSWVWLNATKPAVAVISSGIFNRHGMPGASVIKRLESKGISVAKTNTMGWIRVITDGERLKILNLVNRKY